MLLYEFRLLSEDVLPLKVWDGGYINYEDEQERRVFLYRTDESYVEIYHNQITDTILRLTPFSLNRRMELYLGYSLN